MKVEFGVSLSDRLRVDVMPDLSRDPRGGKRCASKLSVTNDIPSCNGIGPLEPQPHLDVSKCKVLTRYAQRDLTCANAPKSRYTTLHTIFAKW